MRKLLLAIVVSLLPAFAVAQEPTDPIDCLAMNIYHEARGEDYDGMLAVGYVTMNRVHSKKFPNTICAVVKQAKRDDNGAIIKHKCQFSWYCDGKSDVRRDKRLRKMTKEVAEFVFYSYGSRHHYDPTQGATFYHADYARPFWASKFKQLVQIGSHIFYKGS